jgi:hypothetical protein
MEFVVVYFLTIGNKDTDFIIVLVCDVNNLFTIFMVVQKIKNRVI